MMAEKLAIYSVLALLTSTGCVWGEICPVEDQDVSFHIAVDVIEENKASGTFDAYLARTIGPDCGFLNDVDEVMSIEKGTFSGEAENITVTFDARSISCTNKIEKNRLSFKLEECHLNYEQSGMCEIFCSLPDTVSDKAFELRFPGFTGDYRFGTMGVSEEAVEYGYMRFGGGEAQEDYPEEFTNNCAL